MRLIFRFKNHRWLWLLLGCILYNPSALASLAGVGADTIGRTVDQIRVSGNEKTQEKYVIEWTGIEPGDRLSIPMLTFARQELLDTDLFKEVRMQTERYENGELVLGQWQSVMLVELDGTRQRKVAVRIFGE